MSTAATTPTTAKAELAAVKTKAGRVKRAQVKLENERAQLDDAIRDAHDAGVSLRRIGAMADLTHETVRSITRR
jgi:hypothetical protein